MLLLIGSEPFLRFTTKLFVCISKIRTNSLSIFCLYRQTVCPYFVYTDKQFVLILLIQINCLSIFCTSLHLIINLISCVLFRYKHFIAFRGLSGVHNICLLPTCRSGFVL